MTTIDDLISRAGRYDADLARDIAEYVRGRQYGLVFEASKPEHVRLWNKPIAIGDLVNILPPRGQAEDTASDTDPADIIYAVKDIDGSNASLVAIETREEVTAAIDDLVALARFDQPIYAGLKETERVERGGDKPYHTVINGENFHALQTLIYAYQGRVDCIYIDPPYNTGAKDWKYNNNYVGAEDVYRHSKWLTFMEDRLKLAKKLLNPNDSVLIVTIDEKEYLRLGLLLEQMFPEAAIEMVTSVISAKGVARTGQFSRVEEYLYFVRFGDSTVGLSVDNMLDDKRNAKEKIGKDVDWLGLRRREPSAIRGARANQFYPIFVDTITSTITEIGDPLSDDIDRNTVVAPEGTIAVWPLRPDGREGIWGITPETARRDLREGFIRASISTRKGQQTVNVKYLAEGTVQAIYLHDIEIVGKNEDGSVVGRYKVAKGVIPKRVWNKESHNAESHGSLVVGSLLPGRRFPYPKSLYAVEDSLRFFVADKPNALIVDFFSGSGSTAHATMRLNKQDGGRRRCISVTNNEVSADEQKKFVAQGLRQGDSEWEKYGICEYITKPRIKAAITGMTPDGEPIKGDYKFTDEFSMADGFEENAIFFDLEYLEPMIVSADLAFDEIAPILWMRGGCEGPILTQEKGYVVGKTYAVLFNNRYVRPFIEAVKADDNIRHVFVVTDLSERYRDMCAEFPGRDVVQLYESYLHSFEINTGA